MSWKGGKRYSPNLRHHLEILLDILSKNTKNCSYNSWSLGGTTFELGAFRIWHPTMQSYFTAPQQMISLFCGEWNMTVNTGILVSNDVWACRRYWRFGVNILLPPLGLKWREFHFLKYWYVLPSPHCTRPTSQHRLFKTLRTWNTKSDSAITLGDSERTCRRWRWLLLSILRFADCLRTCVDCKEP